MNRKHLILLALPALMLSGCNKEISAADAKAKAKEIEEHEVKAEDYKALSVSMKMSEETAGKVQGETMNAKMETNQTYEFNVDSNYIHTIQYSKVTEGEKSETSDLESWLYIKDGGLYTVSRANDGKEEQKTYSVVEGLEDVIKPVFQKSLDSLVKSVLEEASDKDNLELVSQIADGQTPEGAKYEAKYYTAGDGNLTVEAKATMENYSYEGVKANGSGTVKYAWDKYLLSEIAVKSELAATDTESDTNATFKMDMSEKLAFECKVNYPDLSGYTKA